MSAGGSSACFSPFLPLRSPPTRARRKKGASGGIIRFYVAVHLFSNRPKITTSNSNAIEQNSGARAVREVTFLLPFIFSIRSP